MSILWIENISLPSVEYTSNDLSATHEDKTNDLLSWDQYGQEVLQFLHVRKFILALVITKASQNFSTWGTLTAEEKEVAARWICAPYVLRVPGVVTDEEDLVNWTCLIEKTKGFDLLENTEGRAYIIALMRARVSENLRKDVWIHATADSFYFDTSAHIMAHMFANTKCLINWINNEPGTPFENAGFAETSYFDATLKTDLNTIYNGLY